MFESLLAHNALMVVQPLQSLPSTLAIRDVRRRVAASHPDLDDPDNLIALLALDPLACLRVLRLVHAPMHGGLAPRDVGLRPLVRFLGTAAVTRALDVPVVDPERTRRLRRLWLHSIATAVSAERLCSRLELGDPEHAYLRGLLCHLTPWLRLLGLHHNGDPGTIDGAALTEAWNLPLEATATDREAVALELPFADLLQDDPGLLLTIARRLAELAGFPPPDLGQGDSPEPVCLSGASREALIEAHEIARSVAARLEPFGLDLSADDVPERPPLGDDDQPLFQTRCQGDPNDLVLGLLHCREAAERSQVETLTCAAALRYLDFDRAYLIGYDRERRLAFLRSGADRSVRGIQRQAVTPSPEEVKALEASLADGHAQILCRSDPPSGLCALLAADRMLAVAVPGPWQPAPILLLDRAPTTRMFDLRVEGLSARTLAGCAAVVTENLELRLRHRRAERDATTDPLTGLFNRGVGITRLEQELSRAARDDVPLCVMMADLDQFKQLNDALGHLRGDEALRTAAQVLRRNSRIEDTVCRYGGEEFLLVLPNTSVEAATILATRLFTEIELTGKDAGLPLTISIGLATRQAGDNFDSLVGRADHALYASKRRGRNRFSAAVS